MDRLGDDRLIRGALLAVIVGCFQQFPGFLGRDCGGFDQIVNLYNSLTYSVGDILDTYAYRVGLVDFDYSLSTALSLFKNVIGLIMVLITNYVTKKLGQEGVY